MEQNVIFGVWGAIHIDINSLSILNNVLCTSLVSVRNSAELLSETAVKQFFRFIYLLLFVVVNNVLTFSVDRSEFYQRRMTIVIHKNKFG